MDDSVYSFKQGSLKAFEVLYNKYFPKVCYFARQYLPDEDSAKSLAHDVFLSLWENRELIDPKQNLQAYILTITKNKCLNKLKHLQVKSSYANKVQEQAILNLNQEALSNRTADLLLENDLKGHLNRELDKLSPPIREAFILSRFKMLSYKEIASFQSVSIKTVEYRIMQALKHIRKGMKDFF